MELDFNSFDQEFNNYEEKYVFLLNKTLKHLSLSFEPYISVTLVDNDYIHEINRQYRHIDRPTDVISFESEYDEFEEDDGYIGDIFICIDKVYEQALSYGHSNEREFAFLLCHGILHLHGYDHMEEDEEKVMFEKQDEILNQLNYKR